MAKVKRYQTPKDVRCFNVPTIQLEMGEADKLLDILENYICSCKADANPCEGPVEKFAKRFTRQLK